MQHDCRALGRDKAHLQIADEGVRDVNKDFDTSDPKGLAVGKRPRDTRRWVVLDLRAR